MNLLMISHEYPPYLVGGVGTHVQQLARGLVSAGHTVQVLSFSMQRTFTVDDNGVNVHFLQFPFGDRRDQYHGNLSELETTERSLARYGELFFERAPKPDIIHAHEWLTFGCAQQLRVRLHAPVVLTNHMVWAGVLGSLTPHADKGQIIERERESCRNANKVIAVSQSIRQEIIAYYGVSEADISVVFNGFEPANIEAYSSRSMAEQILGEHLTMAENKIVAYAGRLSPQKGVSALLRSAMRVLKTRNDVRYVIAGRLDPGGYSDLLIAMTEHNPLLRDKVAFLGWIQRQHLPILYKLATIAVVPSIYEPFGYAAIEAMATGTPVVASNTGGLAEIIEDGCSGLLVPVSKNRSSGAYEAEVQALCEAQLRILNDAALARRLGENAQLRVRSKFNLHQMVSGTLRIYESLIPTGCSPSAEMRASGGPRNTCSNRMTSAFSDD